jgi:hypothetical protein
LPVTLIGPALVGMERAAYLCSTKLTRLFFLVFYAAATMCDASVCGCPSRLRSQEGFVLTRNDQLPSLGAAPRLYHNTLQHQDQSVHPCADTQTHRLRLTHACVPFVPPRPLEPANTSWVPSVPRCSFSGLTFRDSIPGEAEK